MPKLPRKPLGIDVTIEKVTDVVDIARYGIMSTPGLVVDEKVVSQAGAVLSTSEIVPFLGDWLEAQTQIRLTLVNSVGSFRDKIQANFVPWKDSRMKRVLSFLCFVAMTFSAQAQVDTLTSGEDQFTAGASYQKEYSAAHDVFAVGNVVSASGSVAGDVHVAGYDVDVSVRTGADLYAMGATVKVGANVVEDLSVMGYSVGVENGATVGGNARMIGQTVRMDGVVSGAFTASGAQVFVNGQINGDATIYASRINFGPDAKIAGQLTYASETPVQIPESVVAAGRVTVAERPFAGWKQEMNDSWDQMEMPVSRQARALQRVFD